MNPTDWGWLVLAFPLAGLFLVTIGWKALGGRTAGWIASAAIGLSFVSSIGMLITLLGKDEEQRSLVGTAFTYIDTAGFHADLAILVDPLAVIMCLIVSGVSFLIHLYSISYMTADRGFNRFFAYLNFFVFSMLLLVLASNFVLLIVGWAFVGAASYLLISFYYRRTTATAAGIKAFVINVIGDVGLVIGAFLLFDRTGALDYAGVFNNLDLFSHNETQLVFACIFILIGAFAKSAQLPLHTWLPDAMEGPTPVSALIHAATMVTAGVYLIARTHPLFELAPTAADISAVIGTATLIFAATVALVQTDLKRVIAYSTMSQIGYMILGVSVAAYGAGIFHLMTHAFFKALLFMGAGSVIGAMGGEQSMDKMGGLRKAMPFTYATFVIGGLALAGFPIFSGFFSKDEIIAYTLNRGGGFVVLGVVAYIAALLTAFYTFRMIFRVFWGEPVEAARELEQGHLHHAEPFNPATGEKEDTDVGFAGPEHVIAEREWPMKAAMGPLAVLAIIAGVLGIPGVTDTLETFLEPTFGASRFAETAPSHSSEWIGLVIGGVIAIAGIFAAYTVFVKRDASLRERLIERYRPIHSFLFHKWYFDELFNAVFVQPGATLGRLGQTVVESRLVQGVLVGGTVGVVRAGTTVARGLQTGVLRSYAFVLVISLGALGLYFLLVSS